MAINTAGANALVGVAISAALLPPLVNCGFCVSFAAFAYNDVAQWVSKGMCGVVTAVVVIVVVAVVVAVAVVSVVVAAVVVIVIVFVVAAAAVVPQSSSSLSSPSSCG